MPLHTIRLKPGVDIDSSPTLNQVRFAACNLVRFYGGLIQKIGGWQQIAPQLFAGICRGLHAWADIMGNTYVAAGTDQRLSVIYGGALGDITPLAQTDNLSPAFTTVTSSATVKIADAAYSPLAGDWINLPTHVAIGGLALYGFYQVASVASGTEFNITASSPAGSSAGPGGAVAQYTTVNTTSTITATLANHGLNTGDIYVAGVSTTVATIVISGPYSVTKVSANQFTFVASGTANASTSAYENSGNAQIEYLIPSGYSVNTALTGYGIGNYGAGDYGSGSGGQVIGLMRQWSLDHWGQYLIASPSNGAIYYWNPPTPSPAAVISAAPLYNTAVFVMPQVEVIVSLGAEISGTQQPLLIRWCDAANFNDWTASATNQAGSYSIPTGSRLIGGLAVGLGAVIWTDNDMWSMSYIGFPLVFSFNRVTSDADLVGQRAVASVNGTVMWLGTYQFYKYKPGGGVVGMECPVWDFFYNNVDTLQLGAVTAAANSLFGEIAWYFPIATTSPIYSAQAPYGYVKVNLNEGDQVWDYGQSAQMQRTAWIDHNPYGNPIGADLNGALQQHEVGYDANGYAMNWFWQTGYFYLQEGEDFVFADMLIPDFVTQNSPSFSMTLLVTDYPEGTVTQVPLITISTGQTNVAYFNARGRQMALLVSGGDLSTFYRIGAIRIRYAPDGRF